VPLSVLPPLLNIDMVSCRDSDPVAPPVVLTSLRFRSATASISAERPGLVGAGPDHLKLVVL
jgi:hypothetical protein